MNIHEETLKIARNLIKKDPSLTDWVISKFPELAESEDERMRKELICFLETEIPQCNARGKYIAWLEKQGEHKPQGKSALEAIKEEKVDNRNYSKPDDKIEPRFKVGDTIKCKYDDRQFTIKSVDLDEGTYTYTQEGCGNDIDYADEEFELVEHNPADKVEPKFKVGDWITMDGWNYHIDEVLKSCYNLSDINGNYTMLPHFAIDDYYRPWTIQDAKDGDVLAYNDGSLTIFRYRLSGLDAGLYMSHVLLTDKIEFKQTCAISNAQPATKEQRDTLEKAMTDAGWEFDFDKKELKKIVDEEQIKKNLQNNSFRRMFEQNPTNSQFTPEQANILDKHIDKHLEQKPAEWSEEDEGVINHLLAICAVAKRRRQFAGCLQEDITKYQTWLKSLRPLGYNSYKATVESIAKMCEKYKNCMWNETEARDFLSNISAKCHEAAEYEKKYPQKQWKPSDKQMEALDDALSLAKNCGEESAFDLRTLYEQLKKL